MSTIMSDVTPCNPASPRRSQVPGPVSEKFVTEDSTGVAAQASVSVNATGEKPKARLVQQAFHKGMFINRPRSSSVGELCITTPQPSKGTMPHSLDWQKVPTTRSGKRRRTSISPPSESLPMTSNSYDILPVDAPESFNRSKAGNKPPPLILYGIEDVTKLKETLETVLDPSDFSFKIVTKTQLRVNCSSPESYKKLMNLVREKGLIGHTFTRKEDRCCRIVIRNLHHTTPHAEIIKEIESTGNKVVGEIINARSGPEKKPSSTFFVNLEPNINNKKVKDIKYIYNTSVKMEDPKKRKTIPQCNRCQQYGHTKNNCTKPFRCVKCAESHKTSDCLKKDRNSPAKCALCFGNHPANYKGCQVYKEIYDRKFNKRPKQPTISQPKSPTMKEELARNIKTINNPTSVSNENYQQSNATSIPTYAGAVKGPNSQQSTSNLVEDLLIKQSEKIEALLQQISSMMSLIVKLVDRLSRS